MINLGRALAFNGLTTSLAAVGFAYAEGKFGGQETTPGRVALVLLLAVFSFSFVMGLLVAGKAADFAETVTDTDDEALKRLGRRHTFALLAGLGAVAVWFLLLEFGLVPRPATEPGCQTAIAMADGTTVSIGHACDAVTVTTSP